MRFVGKGKKVQKSRRGLRGVTGRFPARLKSVVNMPTDWLNMPEMPRDVQFPSTRRRVGVGVLYVFALSCSLILWSHFQSTLVKLILWVLVWPFSTTRWAITYLPPFEGTPGAAGEVRVRS